MKYLWNLLNRILTHSENLKNIALIIAMITAGNWAYFVYFNNAEFKLIRLEREEKMLNLLPSLVFTFKHKIIGLSEENENIVLIEINIKNVGGGVATLFFREPPLKIARVTKSENGKYKFEKNISLELITIGTKHNTQENQKAQIIKKSDDDKIQFLTYLRDGIYFVEFKAEKGNYDSYNHLAKYYKDVTSNHVRWGAKTYININQHDN